MGHLVLLAWLAFASAAVFDCGTAPTVPQDRRVDKSRLRLAHWNVEWLFLSDWGRRWESLDEAQAHLAAVAEVVARNRQVDVWHLAEVEDCAALRELARAAGDASLRAYLVPGRDSATRQQVGLLTRLDPAVLHRSEARAAFPLPGSSCRGGRPGRTGVSKHLVAEFRPKGGTIPPFSIVGAHLLAHPKRPERCARREGQAAVLQQLVRTQLQRTNNYVLVMGDLNEFDAQVQDVQSSAPLSRTLALLKNVLADRPGDELHNVAREVGQNQRFTSYHHGDSDVCLPAHASSSSIDHVLASEPLLALMSEARIGNADFHPPCRADRPYSDHWPVFVTLGGGTQPPQPQQQREL